MSRVNKACTASGPVSRLSGGGGREWLVVRKVAWRAYVHISNLITDDRIHAMPQWWIQVSGLQGQPTTVFCKISVRRSKYCLEFSSTWRRLKISRWPFNSCKIFEVHLKNSLRFSHLFSHFTSQVRLNFVGKRKPKIIRFKNVMERGIRKCLTFVKQQIASKFFGKILLKPLVILKRLKFP